MPETIIEIPVALFPTEVDGDSGQPAWGMRSNVRVQSSAVRLLERETAERHNVIPISQQGRILLVAMSEPGNLGAIQAITKETGLRVRAVEADANEIRQTLLRFYASEAEAAAVTERMPLGWMLLDRGNVTLEQLNEALEIQQRSGERLGKVLVTRGFVNRLTLSEVIADQFRLPHVNLREDTPPLDVVRLLDPAVARRLEAVPVRWLGPRLMVAVVDPSNLEAQVELRQILQAPLLFAVTSELDIDWILARAYRSSYVEESVAGLLYRDPDESAYETFTDGQIVAALVILLLIIVGFVINAQGTLITINAVIAAFYLAISIYRLWLAFRGASINLTINVPEEEIGAMDDADLPVYTILVPLFREKEVLPELVRSIQNLEYPKMKLDVKLLLEETDRETFMAAVALRPPSYFQFVPVPDSAPRTKPKACNYGLVSSRGQFVVVYDAEDQPEPDQLKRAVAAFRRAPADIICLQAKLNYYNRDQNLLTRWFTTEYSTWFDLVLPGLDNTNSPIPLGGTSNHFYTEKLRELGGWDPFNVTEDADLGIRMFKRGYRTAILDSTTFEEANSEWRNWIRQRSRWVKGYMQTWLVHMRHPFRLLLSLGAKAYTSFHFTVGGTPLVFLLNPIYWLITTIWFLTRWRAIPPLFPAPVYYLSFLNLLLGNFIFVYLNLAGSYRRGYYELGRAALISPLYWILMSVAAWRALWQLLTKPYHWEKTIHGLDTKRRAPRRFLDPLVSRSGGTTP
ncbi:MAG: glycosyltransferase [Chloroflexi bacterium]|nr:glycosyltransferase [Chloroflexota bacterium]